MKKEISFILSGRDDGYTGDFIDRFAIALNKNLSIIDKNDFNCEVIIVDYNPLGEKLLINNDKLKSLLQHPKVRNIIVDNSVVVKDELPVGGFYEYFAKNIAAHLAESDFLFMTNADIIISSDIIKYINNDLQKDDYLNHFYRVRYRQDVSGSSGQLREILDLYTPNDEDEPICGGYSGDATIFHKDVFINVATGYNEIDPNHRTSHGQASMDGEILWNLYNKGITKRLVDLVYYHVEHPRQPKDNSYSKKSYNNRDNWGCQGFPQKKINENTILIYK